MIDYGVQGDIIHVIVKDNSGRRLDEMKVQISDKKKCEQLLRDLKEKYGFKPEISPNEKIMDNFADLVGFEKIEKKIDWFE